MTPTTSPCARASSPHWNASCWDAAASHRRPRPEWRSHIHRGVVQSRPPPFLASAIYPQSPTRCRYSRKPKQPKRQTVYQTGSTPVQETNDGEDDRERGRRGAMSADVIGPRPKPPETVARSATLGGLASNEFAPRSQQDHNRNGFGYEWRATRGQGQPRSR